MRVLDRYVFVEDGAHFVFHRGGLSQRRNRHQRGEKQESLYHSLLQDCLPVLKWARLDSNQGPKDYESGRHYKTQFCPTILNNKTGFYRKGDHCLCLSPIEGCCASCAKGVPRLQKAGGLVSY